MSQCMTFRLIELRHTKRERGIRFETALEFFADSVLIARAASGNLKRDDIFLKIVRLQTSTRIRGRHDSSLSDIPQRGSCGEMIDEELEMTRALRAPLRVLLEPTQIVTQHIFEHVSRRT